MKEDFKFILTKYFQKSEYFLFPVLSIPKNSGFKPIGTYIQWKEKDINEYSEVLIVAYKKDDSDTFKRFEKKYLLSNKLFKDFLECEDDINVYLFTFEQYRDDWFNFLEGGL